MLALQIPEQNPIIKNQFPRLRRIRFQFQNRRPAILHLIRRNIPPYPRHRRNAILSLKAEIKLLLKLVFSLRHVKNPKSDLPPSQTQQ
jgi:hypothetical protein